MEQQKPVPFKKVIEALLDEENIFPPRYLYRFSDMAPNDLTDLKEIWPRISLLRRRALMEDIRDFNEEDFILNFLELGTLAVQDPDEFVRLMAVLVLAEYGGDEMVPLFMHLAEQDPHMEVRAAATASLGVLVQQGELDELPAASLQQLENCLLRILDGQDAEKVRLCALEAMGYSSRDEVVELVQNAYQSGNTEWLASALVAMGRSYNPEWNEKVIDMLNDKRSAIRREAVRAAGELEIKEATADLMELLQDDEITVRQAAIWSLSQIGGADVRRLFERMLEVSEDEEEAELLEDALENLEFTEGFPDLALIDLDEDVEDLKEDLNEE